MTTMTFPSGEDAEVVEVEFLSPGADNRLLTLLVDSGFTGKSSFVEHRTYLHLFRSFHRLWIFMVIMFQVGVAITNSILCLI